MRWTQRYGVVAVTVILFLVFVYILQQKSKFLSVVKLDKIFFCLSWIEFDEEEARQTIESLQNRIDYVSRLNDKHLQELSTVKQQNVRLIRSINSLKTCHRRFGIDNNSSINSTSALTDELLVDNSFDSLKNGFHLPSSFSYLKHLHGKHDMLSPSFRRHTTNIDFLRINVSFVIGIPTVKRDKQSYLIETMKSLIDNLNTKDIKHLLLVIFIAEPFDSEYVRTTAQQIEKLYGKYIEDGLIEIISPPVEFYPDFDRLTLSLNDDKFRVKWRTKQNYDFTYLMMYSSIRGKYYIQLEDDVVTKPDYIHAIERFISQQKTQDWFMLEYSSLGKLTSLNKFINVHSNHY